MPYSEDQSNLAIITIIQILDSSVYYIDLVRSSSTEEESEKIGNKEGKARDKEDLNYGNSDWPTQGAPALWRNDVLPGFCNIDHSCDFNPTGEEVRLSPPAFFSTHSIKVDFYNVHIITPSIQEYDKRSKKFHFGVAHSESVYEIRKLRNEKAVLH
ncbi:uncharacterized protein RSE6_01116 [Rhynchosporium secalis]|uniref:Uncharacterized protein n=1 Tax=Rhynchosporium secalis TaxID=38038 RepID=A0A1E1LWY1_RHYSE|nr:uncharacterized protein RSE6_01116 [Rhynchosporium secalis]